ncbi:MAG TPA: outer membrane lipoprotein carrier protein LolA [Polyangiaceae bacterium]|nr:outer membrane lipoprotein carrier protein LolA [Polyangiaceae bacterium]
MKRRSFAALSLLSLAFPLLSSSSLAQQAKPAKALPALSADEIVGRVQTFYDQLKTFKASFKQRYTIKSHDKTKDSAGSVIFEKPGKMSWRYTSNGNRVVSDGKIIKIYEKDNKQMYEQLLDKTQYPAALSFLTGQGKLKQNFKFSKQDSVQMKYASGYVLLGEPLQPTAAYDKVYFYVDGTTFQVRRVIIVDAQQNKNRFDFEAAQANTKPPQGEFVFIPPPGTQVIKP